MLALVVADAACIETAIANGRLKRRRNPFLKWIGWLDIVMPIKQNRRSAGPGIIFAENHRPAASRHDAYGQAHVSHHVRDIFRDFTNPLTIRADTWTAQIIDQSR